MALDWVFLTELTARAADSVGQDQTVPGIVDIHVFLKVCGQYCMCRLTLQDTLLTIMHASEGKD